ncbi:hypothetical protein [Desulforamulus ferrireducens]|uniref:Lipoprotein n=1 Tax=Desulforamulus ferrireducens TaxID=1833852 RepID=A0A1S6IZR2_9FIRM|nr:hypothetical protein [Desulforamulus ferrireducens]AQS60244.1 hypothetical protein B0537_14870 [Desulforamulus ferrireducens]
MKRIMTTLLAMVMMIAMLTGCGSDPVAEELEKFLNQDMVAVNAKYEELKAEMNKWDSLEDDAALIASLKGNVLPNIDESLAMLSKIDLQTEELKAIKEKYQKMLEAYKEGFQIMLSAAEAGDEAGVEASGVKIDEGIKLLDEYNKALEDLAKEKNMEVTYESK